MSSALRDLHLVVRASSLAGYDMCPRRAVAHHLRAAKVIKDLRPTGTNWSSIAGTVTHGLYHVDAGGERDRAVEDMVLEEELTYTKRGTPVLTSQVIKSREACIDIVKRNLRRFDEFAPMAEIRPRIASGEVVVEHRMVGRFTTDVGEEVGLTGHVDLYDPEARMLVDIKCTANRKAPMPMAQLGAYIHLLGPERPVERIEIWALRFDRVKEAGEVEVVEHSPAECTRAFATSMQFTHWCHERYEYGDDLNAVPAHYGDWHCSNKWCGAYATPHCSAYQDAFVETDPR